jgi:hypothetical protein
VKEYVSVQSSDIPRILRSDVWDSSSDWDSSSSWSTFVYNLVTSHVVMFGTRALEGFPPLQQKLPFSKNFDFARAAGVL